jgi:hypothetical protein
LEIRDSWTDQEADVAGKLGSQIRVEREGRVLRIVLVRPERATPSPRSSLTSFGPQCLSWREASGASPLSPRGRRFAWEGMSASSLRHLSRELLCTVGPPVAPGGARTDGFCRTDCGRGAGLGGRWWPDPDVAGRRAGPRTVSPGTAAYTVIGPRMAACPGRCRAVWLRLTCWYVVGDKATPEYGWLI